MPPAVLGAPGVRTRGRPGARVTGSIALLGLLLLLAIPANLGGASGGPGPGAPRHLGASDASAVAGAAVSDGGVVRQVVGGLAYLLSDAIVPGTLSPSFRSYQIILTVTHPLPLVRVNVSTFPIARWAGASQIPGGPDILPSISGWNWVVRAGTLNDTANWTAVPSSGVLFRNAPWRNISYTVQGTPNVSVALQISSNVASGTRAPGIGFVMSMQVPWNDPDFTSSIQPVHPDLLRWSQPSDAPATWNNTTQRPVFDFTAFGPMMNVSKAIGAQAYLSLPAGSWGDGNDLPAGMPLNQSMLVNWYGHSTGYFPNLVAYATFVTTFAKQIQSHGWSITYWNIGNEVPVAINVTITVAFEQVFNVAERAIHAVFPSALVGSDVLMAKMRIPSFAANLHSVGFLGFHAYPASRLCPTPTTYCPPNDVNGYLTDRGVLNVSTGFAGYWEFPAPVLAQQQWHNLTGRWIPMIDAETNLNSAQAMGSDPRQQTLFNAAWLTSSLIDGAAQNLSDELFYSFQSYPSLPPSPTLAYGGWGFGSMVETTTDQETFYAPYWAAKLWGATFPDASSGVRTVSADPMMVRAFAAIVHGNLSVAITNLYGVDVSVPVSVSGASWSPVREQTLDSRSYRMGFNSSSGLEQLYASGLTTTVLSPSASVDVSLQGYGVTVLTYTPHTSPQGGGGGGGNGSAGNGSVPPPTGNSSGGTGTPPPPGSNTTGSGGNGTGGSGVNPPPPGATGNGTGGGSGGVPPTGGPSTPPPASSASGGSSGSSPSWGTVWGWLTLTPLGARLGSGGATIARALLLIGIVLVATAASVRARRRSRAPEARKVRLSVGGRPIAAPHRRPSRPGPVGRTRAAGSSKSH